MAGKKTSVYITDEIAQAVQHDGRSLADLIRAGLGTGRQHAHQCTCGELWPAGWRRSLLLTPEEKAQLISRDACQQQKAAEDDWHRRVREHECHTGCEPGYHPDN